MSETTKTGVGKEVMSLDVSPQFNAYSGVEIIVSEEISYFAGNRNGRVLTIQNPWGTQAQANAILSDLQAKGFQYQPYTADGAMLNPAAEIGDGITISDTYSGIYKIDRNYTPLMAADVEAPQDEEIDHEYPYEPKQNRVYKREIAEANAQISINANAITAEVNRATTSEGNLSTRITQNATSISTEVSQRKSADNTINQSISTLTQTANNISATVSTVNSNKLDHTRTNASFGWDLTSSAFKINSSGSKNVFTCNSSGITIQGNATVTGKIQATSGFIGSSAGNGFTIRNTGISYGTVNSGGDDLAVDSSGNYVSGVFISRNRIRLGNNFVVTNTGAVTARDVRLQGGSIQIRDGNGNVAFQVTSTGAVTATNLTITGGSIKLGSNFSVTTAGNVTANNMTLKGTLTVGGSTITADSLRQGAERANSGYSNWNSAYSSTSSGGYCYNGATNGNSAQATWGIATARNGGLSYLEANDLCARRALWLGDMQYGMGTIDVPSAGYITIGTRTYYITFSSYYHYSCMRPR